MVTGLASCWESVLLVEKATMNERCSLDFLDSDFSSWVFCLRKACLTLGSDSTGRELYLEIMLDYSTMGDMIILVLSF